MAPLFYKQINEKSSKLGRRKVLMRTIVKCYKVKKVFKQ